MMIDTIIFDMDGTLLDTLDDLTGAVNHAMAELGYPVRDREDIRRFMGNGLEALITRSLPDVEPQSAENLPLPEHREADVESAIGLFKEFYAVHGNDNTKPYAGIRELLSELRNRGIRTAVLSNKYEAAVIELADEYFPGSFDAVRGEREHVPRKPAPDAVFSIMEELAADPSGTMYVGDSEVDMQTGRNACVITVGVLWGFRSREALEESGAQHIIGEPMELLELL